MLPPVAHACAIQSGMKGHFLMRFVLALLLATVLTRSVSTSAETAQPKEVSNFALIDHQGKLRELKRSNAKAVVLFFTANGCPVVRQNASKISRLREAFQTRGVDFWMVNSSSADDRREISKEAGELRVWQVPVLKDDTQGLARHLGVRRTAEAIAISTKDWTVFYRGALDDQMAEGAGKPQPTEKYLELALNDFLSGLPIRTAKTQARGCVIHFDGGKGPDDAPVAYATEVAPILAARCVSCHSPGNVGSWAMSSHRKVKGMASMIEETLLARRMPPWDADPHAGKFANDSAIQVAEAQTLLRWIHQGAPRGEGADPLESLKVTPAPEWPLGQPDIVLRLPKPEIIPATGVLDYRHIEVHAGNETERWVGAMYVRPGNREVVHHVIARLKKGGNKDALGQDEMFVGWAPGTTQDFFPTNSGKRLPAKAVFDLEMHYTPNGREQTDQTELGIYLLKEKPAARYEAVPLVNTSFEIQPGAHDFQTDAAYCFKRGATLHSLTPHMHLRGRWMKFEALFPNGKKETLCSVPRYDFNWQQTYVLKEPRRLPPGTWVRIIGGYDNSRMNPSNPDPSAFVRWGEQSADEMFLGWYNVVWDPVELSSASVEK
ncbi:MAG: redoxin domain-containing protein [Verrucomicrobia bacterium]|nr:redoxin domain-containing protein [Verrucomicrobiota bacterium]